MNWTFARFDDLPPHDIHDLYQARVAVFVLEQKCPFQDVDGADPECWIRIGAQQYLERFYGGFGFKTASAPYDEDGILHVEMVRPAGAGAAKCEKIEQR